MIFPPEDVAIQWTEHRPDGIFAMRCSPAKRDARPPLLMIPGRCHGWWAYQGWLESFARWGWSSWACSLRGHYPSWSVPPETYLTVTLEDYVADVTRVLDVINEPVVLFGHSMGGMVAQLVASQSPAEVSALVLLASVGPAALGRYAPELPADVLIDDRDVYRMGHDERTARLLSFESPLAVNQCRRGVEIAPGQVSCPVLAVEGGEDDTGVHRAGDVARHYDGDKLTIPSGSHDLMFDQWAESTAGEIKEWLDRSVLGQTGTPQGS